MIWAEEQYHNAQENAAYGARSFRHEIERVALMYNRC